MNLCHKPRLSTPRVSLAPGNALLFTYIDFSIPRPVRFGLSEWSTAGSPTFCASGFWILSAA